MDPALIALLSAAVASLATAGVTVYRTHQGKPAVEASAAKGIAEAAAVLVGPLQKEIVMGRERIAVLEHKVETLIVAERDCQTTLVALRREMGDGRKEMAEGIERVEAKVEAQNNV